MRPLHEQADRGIVPRVARTPAGTGRREPAAGAPRTHAHRAAAAPPGWSPAPPHREPPRATRRAARPRSPHARSCPAPAAAACSAGGTPRRRSAWPRWSAPAPRRPRPAPDRPPGPRPVRRTAHHRRTPGRAAAPPPRPAGLFPTPPGPVSVTSRTPSPSTRSSTAAASRSRPTNGVAGTGRAPASSAPGSAGRPAEPGDISRQGRGRCRHVAGRAAAGWPRGRRIRRAQPRRGKPEQANRPVEVLQLAFAHVDQREPGRFLVIFNDRLRRLGDEHLAAVRGGADPCGAMHGQSRVPAPGRDGIAGVNAHPDADLRTGGPLMAGQRPLNLHRAQHGLLSPGERDEEGISLGIHLMTEAVAGRRPRGPGAGAWPGSAGSARAASLPGRVEPSIIAEQEGDHAAGKLADPAAPATSLVRTRTDQSTLPVVKPS